MPHCFLRSVRSYHKMKQKQQQQKQKQQSIEFLYIFAAMPGVDSEAPLLTTRSGRVIRRPTPTSSDRASRREMRPHSWSGLPIVTRYILLQRGSRLHLMEEEQQQQQQRKDFSTSSMHTGGGDAPAPLDQHRVVLEKPTELIVQTTIPVSLPATTTPIPQVFNCVQCNRVFASLAAFNAHQRVHYKPTKYLCPYCPKVFARSWLLKGHLRVHTGERPFHCHYEGCNKAFADRSNLRAHELIHTQSSKRWKCPVCGKLFAQKRYLHKHLTEVCKGAMGRRMEAVLVQVPPR